VRTQDLRFPSLDYCLDESDPDLIILRRQDDSFVAAFSARGATKEGIFEAAKKDHRQRIRDRWRLGGKAPEEQHSA
jgi:hypothetical protein